MSHIMNRSYLFSMYANTSDADHPLVSHSETEQVGFIVF